MRDDHEVLDSIGDDHPTSSSSSSARLSQSSAENAPARDLIVGEASIGITELVESEERFRQMADHLEDVIWITDKEIKNILYINPAYEKVYGRPRESLYECLTAFGEAVHPDDLARMERMLERQRDGDLTPVEYRIVRPDGSVRWMQRRSFPIRNKDGEVYRLAGIAQDITERRRAQEELRESEERFRQLSEAPFEAIVVHDNGTILEVNQSFCQMYGYERAEVIGRSVLDLTPPELREPLGQRVRSAGTGRFEGLALRKDGTIFRAEVAAKPIHYQGRVVRVAAVRDITDQRRNERRQAAQYGVTRVLAESVTLAEAIPQLLKVICESKRWKIGEFWRVCDDTNLLRCVETWHAPGFDATSFIEASRQIKFAAGEGLPGRVWQSGQPAWISDLTTDPRFARAEIAVRVGLRGAVAFPILPANHTPGVMLFFSRRDPEADADLLKIMSAIGSQIGQFIERKRAEEALKQSEQDFRNLFERAHDAILVFDPENEFVLDVNERACELYGFTRSEFIGMSLEAISKDVVLGKNKLAETLERGGYLNFESVQYRKDGAEMFLEINASTILYQGQLVVLSINRDVTERKRAENELRVKDNAIESSVTPTVFADLDGRISYVNGAFLNLFGYEHADEVRGRRNTEFVPRPDDLRLITASLHERGSWTGELEAQKQNGSPVYLALVAGLVRDVSGRPLCTMATLADITERRRTEAALRESEERYRDLVENSRELICTHDLNGVILSANPAAAAVLGYDLAELVGKNIQDNLAPEVRDQFDEYMTRLLKDGVTSGIMLVQTKSGEIRVWDYYNSLRTKGVAAPIVRGMARDITEQRRAQKALYESEERYRELFENARDAIYVHDLSGRYTSVNRAAEELSGFRRDEILGKHYSNFMAPSHLKHARENLCKKLDDTLATIYEAEIISKSGRRTPVEISSCLIYENGTPVGVQGIARDLSERKQTQEAMRVFSRALIEAQETERQNIARELHDEIGQVLTAIRINLDHIKGSCAIEQCLPHVDDSIVVVDEALAKVRELSLDLRPSLLDNLGLSAALRWYVDRYAQRTGIAAEIRTLIREQRLKHEVETACFRIVQEALTNVARHAKAKRVEVNIKELDGNVVLTVKDDGIGFDTQNLSNDVLTTLGLLGMAERAQSVGGSFEISSTVFRGTEIQAVFPI